jgi:AcrR family transcriptional regulator
VKGISAVPAERGEPPRDNREAILVAVAKVIARRGVRGLRVEDVASEAGVSAPLLYYHFGSRAGLVKAALEHASERAPSTALSEPLDANGFESVSAALLDELSQHPDVRANAVVWGEVSASAVFESDLQVDVKRVNDAWRSNVAEGIRAGIADGSIRAGVDPEVAADMLISLVDGLCTRWLSGTIERSRAVELLREGLVQTLAPAEPPDRSAP